MGRLTPKSQDFLPGKKIFIFPSGSYKISEDMVLPIGAVLGVEVPEDPGKYILTSNYGSYIIYVGGIGITWLGYYGPSEKHLFKQGTITTDILEGTPNVELIVRSLEENLWKKYGDDWKSYMNNLGDFAFEGFTYIENQDLLITHECQAINYKTGEVVWSSNSWEGLEDYIPDWGISMGGNYIIHNDQMLFHNPNHWTVFHVKDLLTGEAEDLGDNFYEGEFDFWETDGSARRPFFKKKNGDILFISTEDSEYNYVFRINPDKTLEILPYTGSDKLFYPTGYQYSYGTNINFRQSPVDDGFYYYSSDVYTGGDLEESEWNEAYRKIFKFNGETNELEWEFHHNVSSATNSFAILPNGNILIQDRKVDSHLPKTLPTESYIVLKELSHVDGEEINHYVIEFPDYPHQEEGHLHVSYIGVFNNGKIFGMVEENTGLPIDGEYTAYLVNIDLELEEATTHPQQTKGTYGGAGGWPFSATYTMSADGKTVIHYNEYFLAVEKEDGQFFILEDFSETGFPGFSLNSLPVMNRDGTEVFIEKSGRNASRIYKVILDEEFQDVPFVVPQELPSNLQSDTWYYEGTDDWVPEPGNFFSLVRKHEEMSSKLYKAGENHIFPISTTHTQGSESSNMTVLTRDGVIRVPIPTGRSTFMGETVVYKHFSPAHRGIEPGTFVLGNVIFDEDTLNAVGIIPPDTGFERTFLNSTHSGTYFVDTNDGPRILAFMERGPFGSVPLSEDRQLAAWDGASWSLRLTGATGLPRGRLATPINNQGYASYSIARGFGFNGEVVFPETDNKYTWSTNTWSNIGNNQPFNYTFGTSYPFYIPGSARWFNSHVTPVRFENRIYFPTAKPNPHYFDLETQTWSPMTGFTTRSNQLIGLSGVRFSRNKTFSFEYDGIIYVVGGGFQVSNDSALFASAGYMSYIDTRVFAYKV